MATNPISAAYFADAEPYLKRNHRITLRSEIVGELVGQPRGKRILDLGCGNGAISLPLAEHNSVILVDNSAAMLSAAERHAKTLNIENYEAIHADVCGVSVEPVDIVLALGVLAHVDESLAVLQAMARNLKPGGVAVLQFSDSRRLLNRLSQLLFRVRGRQYRKTPRGEILKAADATGLRLVDERSHLLIIPGMPRLMGRTLLTYDRFLRRRHPKLSAHGLDTLLLLAKPVKTASGSCAA